MSSITVTAEMVTLILGTIGGIYTVYSTLSSKIERKLEIVSENLKSLEIKIAIVHQKTEKNEEQLEYDANNLKEFSSHLRSRLMSEVQRAEETCEKGNNSIREDIKRLDAEIGSLWGVFQSKFSDPNYLQKK